MTYEDVKAIRDNPTAEACDLKELQRLINEAIEKQIPKKVIKSSIHGLGESCPNCKSEVKGMYFYCTACGQAIDWNEESENNA
jgi:hypothetical protein